MWYFQKLQESPKGEAIVKTRSVSIGLGLLVGATVALAQSARQAAIHGTVQTEKGEAVEGASVDIKGTGLSTITRSDGTFRIEGVKPGRYWITVKREGLDPSRKAVTLSADEDRGLKVHLNPVSATVSQRRNGELDSLYRAFEERLESSLDGVFLTRDDIARSREPQLGAMLADYLVQMAPRSGAGAGANCAPYESWVFQQTGTQSRFASDPNAYPFISVNGARPFRGRALYEFDPADVEALEFYRGSGPSFGYITSSAQCGLIILWTK